MLRLLPTCRFQILTCLAAVAWFALPAMAIQPQRWVHSTEADFEEGQADGVVVTNLGDVKLTGATETLGELPEGVTLIYGMQTLGDATYLAAGPQAKLLRWDGSDLTEVAELPGRQIFALAVQDDRLIVGVSGGEAAEVMAWDGEALQPLFTLADVQYIWDLLPQGDRLYLATGPEGQIFVKDEGKDAEELLDTAQANVLCLAADGGGQIYAGTDTDGLVYRIGEDGQAFVIYDAAEPEIGALLVDASGNVFVGTADAEQAKPGRLGEAAADETGRPEVAAQDTAAEATPGEGIPVEPPAELPGEPEPMPMQSTATAPKSDVADASEPPAVKPVAANDDEASTPPTQADENQSNADKTDAEADAAPTAEQYDALRAELRRRLLAARESGTLAVASGSKPTRAGKTPVGGGGNGRRGAAASDKSGNAVYRVDPQGFVTEVFRESVMVLSLTQRPDGKLLVATGNEGQLYLVDAAAGESAVLYDFESQQIMALEQTADGQLLLAGSNPAALIALAPAVAAEGTYESVVLDAGQASLWGTLNLTAHLTSLALSTTAGVEQPAAPKDWSVLVETRSGNVADPELAGWSAWVDAGTAAARDDVDALAPYEYKVQSPPARFLQYRLTLLGGDASPPTTPAVARVEIAYVVPNLRPQISALTATYPPFSGVDQPAKPTMTVNWEATDDNGDRLLYTLAFKPTAASNWQTLVEDSTETSFEWDTRKVPDGRYRLRVTATDKLDNPGDMARTAARQADPVLIDNLPPSAQNVKVVVQPGAGAKGGLVSLSGLAKDSFSPIQGVAYSLDDAEQYTPVLADDLIYDSTAEAFSATMSDLSPGGHAVTLRILDSRGNATYVSELFTVE